MAKRLLDEDRKVRVYVVNIHMWTVRKHVIRSPPHGRDTSFINLAEGGGKIGIGSFILVSIRVYEGSPVSFPCPVTCPRDAGGEELMSAIMVLVRFTWPIFFFSGDMFITLYPGYEHFTSSATATFLTSSRALECELADVLHEERNMFQLYDDNFLENCVKDPNALFLLRM